MIDGAVCAVFAPHRNQPIPVQTEAVPGAQIDSALKSVLRQSARTARNDGNAGDGRPHPGNAHLPLTAVLQRNARSHAVGSRRHDNRQNVVGTAVAVDRKVSGDCADCRAETLRAYVCFG